MSNNNPLVTLLKNRNMSEYTLSKNSGVPYSTISDMCSGKTNVRKCNGETILKIAKALHTSMEIVIGEKQEEVAEFDDTKLPYTKFDYYKSQMKFRKNAILRGESAAEYWGITDGHFSHLIKVYATTDLAYPFIVTKVKNFKDIDYEIKDGVLVTSISKTIDDMISDKESDKQILDQALSNYYYRNNESFDGLNISKKNLDKFNKEIKHALKYYEN